MKSRSVAIIGAGMGGICAATHLAQRGFHVTVFDKNPHAGGRCDWIERDGHRFDTGPTLLVMPRVYEAEFAALGTPMHELLDLLPVDPSYHLVFDDGSRFALTKDMQAMQQQLEALEPGAFQAFLRYHREGERHYRLAIRNLVDKDFRRWSDFINVSNLPLLYQVKPFIKHYTNMGHYFHLPRLRAAFSFQDLYMGLSPFDAPATFSLMPYCELEHGVWYPKGGMYSLIQAVMGLAQAAGVEFAFDTTVEQVVVKRDRVAWLEVEHDRQVKADVVLANADLPYVYHDLLPPDGLSDKIMRKDFSCSVVSFFWGVDKPYPALGPHTLFLADDYRQNFHDIIHHLTLPSNPSIYIHAPTRLDASMAPAGEDTLIAIVPVGHLSENGEQDWEALTGKARQEVFRRLRLLGITDLETHLEFETSYTPLSWKKRYNLARGSTHGLSHKLSQLAYFRPANRHPRYRNLYFVGASTHPGTGLPTAMISARLVSQRIQDEFDQLD